MECEWKIIRSPACKGQIESGLTVKAPVKSMMLLPCLSAVMK